MLSYLMRPFAYLTIRHDTWLLVVVNWIVPIITTTIVVMVMAFLGEVSLLGDSGVVARVLGFVQSLAGFYIAALAAVSTFSGAGMDALMSGKPPKINIIHNGKVTQVELTRRRFLCSMFAFLTATSLLITLVALVALMIGPAFSHALPKSMFVAMRIVFAFGFIFALLQTMSVTFLGLFYLGERMHTPD